MKWTIDQAFIEIDTLRKQIAKNAKSCKETIYDMLPVQTPEPAGVVAFSDGADDVPIKKLLVAIDPVQAGSGDPSPENVRPITGWNSVTVTRSGGTTEDTFTISLGRTVYGGTLDVINGILTVNKKYVDMGSLTWLKANDGSIYTIISDMAPVVEPPYTNRQKGVICSAYKADTQNSVAYASMNNNTWLRTSNRIYVKDTRYTEAAEFKAGVAGVQLVYDLTEPITVTLTPTEIKTLKGDNTISANTGNVTVEYRADIQDYIDAKIAETQATMLENIGG